MNQVDKKNWMKKNQKLNENITLCVGMEVQDLSGKKGVVFKIEKWDGDLNQENHGTITVLQHSENNDYFEHYPFSNWKNIFRVINTDIVQNKMKPSTF